IAELTQVGFPLRQLHGRNRGVGAHIAGGTDLFFESQLAAPVGVLNGQTVSAAFSLGFPAGIQITVEQRMAIEGPVMQGRMFYNAGTLGLQNVDKRIASCIDRAAKALQVAAGAVQGRRGQDLAGLEIDCSDKGALIAESDDPLQKYWIDLLRPLR